MADEDLRLEIDRLTGETLALQTIIFWMLFNTDRKTARKVLDDARRFAESQMVEADPKASPEHLAAMLGVIARLSAGM